MVTLSAWCCVAACSPSTRPVDGARPVAQTEAVSAPNGGNEARPNGADARTDSAATSLPALADVSDAVVAAGLRWLVTLRPEALLVKLSAARLTVLEPSRLAAFGHSVGVDVHQMTQAAVAGFDYSTLYLARVAPDATARLETARVRFEARLDASPLSHELRGMQVFSGTRAGLPQHHARLDALTAAWSEGDPTPLKAAVLSSQRRLTKTPAALQGASLGLLPPDCRDGDVVIYVPGPIAPLDTGDQTASAVLASILAASTALTLNGESLAIDGCVVGDWDATGGARVRALLDALLGHRFVSLLALDDAERQVTLTQTGDVVRFAYEWRAAHTFDRVKAVLDLDLRALGVTPSEPR